MELVALAVIILFFLALVLVCVACVLAMPTTLRQMGYSDKELTIWGE